VLNDLIGAEDHLGNRKNLIALSAKQYRFQFFAECRRKYARMDVGFDEGYEDVVSY
jgi:hypothetical protein